MTIDHEHQRSKLPYLLAALIAMLMVGGGTELITGLLKENQLERQRSETMEKLATVRARLEGEINSTLHLTRGLTAYVATHPEVDDTEFTQLSAEIVSVGRNIRNIGLAKNNIITHMYPLAGNEAALGLEYEKNPAQWPAVKRAMELNRTVVAGPVNLVQGGRAFIARTPIYTRAPGVSGILSKHRPAYWGIASIVIDMPPLFQSAGIDVDHSDIELAIRGKDGLGEKGDIFYGKEALFNAEPVLQSVILPNGSWQLAATPIGGWGVSAESLWLPRLAGWFAALLIGGLLGGLLWAHAAQRHQALHDPLTGLPNRRLLEDRIEQMIVRSQRGDTMFAIFYIDLDGFKLVNDKYGHETGDALLVAVSRRMESCVRSVDTVARVGGDEFIVLADSMHKDSDMHRVGNQLRDSLRGEVYINDNRVEIRASIGAATYPGDGESLDELLKTSDRQMYAEKQRGKIHLVGVTGKG